MKKKLVAVVSVSAVLIAAFLIFMYKHISYNTIPADRILLASDFTELEVVSDLIIRAEVMPEKENIVVRAHNDENIILHGYTITQLKVLGVLSGSDNIEKLSITEEYYTTSDILGHNIWSQGNYLPAKVGEEYIFYLKKYPDNSSFAGMYFPVDLENGKYKIMNSTDNPGTATDYELKNNSTLSKYQKLYEQVQKKYMN
jgi:hypothetical protein